MYAFFDTSISTSKTIYLSVVVLKLVSRERVISSYGTYFNCFDDVQGTPQDKFPVRSGINTRLERVIDTYDNFTDSTDSRVIQYTSLQACKNKPK